MMYIFPIPWQIRCTVTHILSLKYCWEWFASQLVNASVFIRARFSDLKVGTESWYRESLCTNFEIRKPCSDEDWSIQSKRRQGFPISKLVSENSPFRLLDTIMARSRLYYCPSHPIYCTDHQNFHAWLVCCCLGWMWWCHLVIGTNCHSGWKWHNSIHIVVVEHIEDKLVQLWEGFLGVLPMSFFLEGLLVHWVHEGGRGGMSLEQWTTKPFIAQIHILCCLGSGDHLI